MTNTKKASLCMAALATVGIWAGSAQASVTRNLVCLACGTWNDQGIRGATSDYQIGYSLEKPHHQAAYFEFDYSGIQGKTVTNLNITIPGSTDYNITDVWTNHTPTHQFRITMHDQGPNSTTDITTGNNNKLLYINAEDELRNGQMGYAWVPDGIHKGLAVDCWHFQLPTSIDFDGFTFQPEVNAGGKHVLWACDGFDSGAGSENYIWGHTQFTTAIVLHVTTTN